MSPRLSPDLIKDCEAICQTEDVRKSGVFEDMRAALTDKNFKKGKNGW
jgi:hypothetical protein